MADSETSSNFSASAHDQGNQSSKRLPSGRGQHVAEQQVQAQNQGKKYILKKEPAQVIKQSCGLDLMRCSFDVNEDLKEAWSESFEYLVSGTACQKFRDSHAGVGRSGSTKF